MDLDLSVTAKLLAASAAWLRNEAIRFARSLTAAPYMSRSRSIDGYIIKATRTGDRATVHIIDTPAQVALPGRALVGAPGSAYLPAHCPLVELTSGRDALLGGAVGDPASLYPQHAGCPPLPVLLGGPTPPMISVVDNRVQPSLSVLPGVGAVELTTPLYMSARYNVNPYAFVSRSNSAMLYLLSLYSPTVAKGSYAQTEGGWTPTGDGVPAGAPWSFVISDNVLWNASGVLPFCKRVSPPPYDPNSTAATTFDNAQLPWGRAIFLERGVTTGGAPYYDTLLVVHVVTDMRHDDDRFGAKGLWFGRIRAIDNPPDSGGPTLDLGWFATDDTRFGADPMMVPVLDPANDQYGTNNLYPAMLTRLANGAVVAVVLHSNWKNTGTGPAPYNVCYTYRWHADSLTKEQFISPVESISLPTRGKRHDFAFPLGVDNDGETAYAVFFSSDADYVDGDRVSDTSIDVVRITPTASTVVLSALIPQRYCRNITNSRFSCVRYIGNGKYMFPATDQATVVDSEFNTRGDLVAMIYDSSTNELSVAGTVLPGPDYRIQLYIGALDCPAPERVADGEVTRPATVILTFGGIGQTVYDPGVEAGETYISRDSGATWTKMADYGSPAGAYYCGTALQPRTRNL